jgi:hypothetical protein
VALEAAAARDVCTLLCKNLQNQLHSEINELRHISIFSVSAMLGSTGGYVSMIFAFQTPPFFLT